MSTDLGMIFIFRSNSKIKSNYVMKTGKNFIAEALVKQGYGLYYYRREASQLEEDFFVRTQQELLPLDVKSNKNTSRSLAELIRNEKYSEIHQGIKMTAGNIGRANGIYTFPYFCAFLLKRYLRQQA